MGQGNPMTFTPQDFVSKWKCVTAREKQTYQEHFFERVPSGGDVYFLKTILHDWSDSQALAILKNCRGSI
jgi:hypothetical protein